MLIPARGPLKKTFESTLDLVLGVKVFNLLCGLLHTEAPEEQLQRQEASAVRTVKVSQRHRFLDGALGS